MGKEYQPKTGAKCSCKPGQQRDNCARCEGTGEVIDFAAIRARSNISTQPGTTITPDEIKDLPTLCTGQCCSLKIQKPGIRVWICRVSGGVSIEFYIPHTGRWDVVAGDCGDTEGATIPETLSGAE